MLERVRSEQREAVALHTAAIEEQHAKEAEELKRMGAEGVRKMEDRVRELQVPQKNPTRNPNKIALLQIRMKEPYKRALQKSPTTDA